MFEGKKILLAVCGSIAAYKTAFFVRLLVKEKAEVKVIMTKSAKDFISPLTLSTLSKNPVYSSYFDQDSGDWHNHVELGLWADIMMIAPLTANTLGKMANGICDNLLMATYLSAKCPVMVAPAMDLDMYSHPSTQKNLKIIESFGNQIVEAREGELASGLEGQGRMAEPEELLEILKKKLSSNQKLKGKKILITSGPTYEALDPVRFIGNHSSGKMGAALADLSWSWGAEVQTISGPAQFLPKNGKLTKVQSAEEMLAEASKTYPKCDVAIFAAAVSDYRPKDVQDHKIKKSSESLALELIKNPDIAFELGRLKKNQVNVGFALETQNESENAKEKLEKKNFDLIVLNSLNDEGAGFKNNTNKVTFYDKMDKVVKYELKDKKEVAEDILNYILENLL